jgi:hypothetical protein
LSKIWIIIIINKGSSTISASKTISTSKP